MPRTAVVTGASRGIGAAIASRLAGLGYFTIGTATSEAGADAISHALGERGTGRVLKVEERAAAAEFVDSLPEGIETPTVLINNAGITRDNLVLRMREDEWDDVLATNTTGLFNISKALLKGMVRARWGRIVNIGSVVARMGNPGQANYVASKSAIEGFSRALALEVASRNITVNTVAPGFIGTDMTEALTEDQTSAMLARIPAGRVGHVDEVAGAVAYLVSDDAAYVTGQTIHVNGGLYAA